MTGSEDRKRREESLLQSTATWEQWWERKKGRSSRSQATKEESSKHGIMYEEVYVSSRCTSGIQKDGPRGMRLALLEAVLKRVQPDTRGQLRVMQTCVQKTLRRVFDSKWS